MTVDSGGSDGDGSADSQSCDAIDDMLRVPLPGPLPGNLPCMNHPTG